MSAKHVSTIVIGICLILTGAAGLQESQWKGMIEEEGGIKVIKNPEEPLYGEITFELEEDLTIGSEEDDNAYFYKGFAFNFDREGNIYVFDRASLRIQKFNGNGKFLQTIGRRGQGPGEFQDLFSMLFLDAECNLYVRGKRKIQVFNKKGEFVKSTPLDTDVSQFGMIGEENVLAETFSSNANGHIHEIIILNSNGERVKTLAGLLRPRMDLKVKSNIIFSHPYGQNIYFCVIDKDFGVYGNSSAYKLFGINSSGDLVHIIEKEEPPQKTTRKEKDLPIDRLIDAYKKHDIKIPRKEIEKWSNLLEFKPFYNEIISDDLGRIYVRKVGSILVKENEANYDLFSRDGYYLYRVRMPYLPEFALLIPYIIIKNGCIYWGEHDKETMLDLVKRYKIKNWEELKEGIK